MTSRADLLQLIREKQLAGDYGRLCPVCGVPIDEYCNAEGHDDGEDQ